MILDEELMGAIEGRVKNRKEVEIAALKIKQADLRNQPPDHLSRATQLSSEKRASCVFYLNKRAIGHFMMPCDYCLRYNWRIEQMQLSFVLAERETL